MDTGFICSPVAGPWVTSSAWGTRRKPRCTVVVVTFEDVGLRDGAARSLKRPASLPPHLEGLCPSPWDSQLGAPAEADLGEAVTEIVFPASQEEDTEKMECAPLW